MAGQRILHVINSLDVGGAEKLLVGIINSLTDFENHVLILHHPETLLSEITNMHSFLNLDADSFAGSLLKVRIVRRYIRKKKINIVHSHLFESNILTRLATPRNVKLFNSIHAVSSLASYNISKPALWLEKLTYKKRHHIICVSRTVLDDFNDHVNIQKPGTVLYNYVDDHFEKQVPKENFSVGELKLVAVGNLRLQKNYPYLVEAFKKLPKEVSLDIYGEGHLRDELQHEIEKFDLNIRLCGRHNNIYQVLPKYDVFVMSSHFEGQPVALLEAMACGLPALLSDIPVLREVGGSNSIYFDLNDPGDLVNRIQEIRNGKYDLHAMSAYGIEFVKQHANKEHYMKTLINLYLHDN